MSVTTIFRSRVFVLLAVLVALAGSVHAQQKADTADKVKIIIANTGAIEHYQTDSGSYNKFVGDVVIYQGTDTLYCDSLYQYIESKKLEAFSNVRIAQAGGTEATCDYLRYQSDRKLAYMQGNVSLIDGDNKLWCEELTYDLGTKTGTYNKNGTLQSDSTIVSSIFGIYNVRSHDARFTGDVRINDPKYKITSKDLGYNAETKVETFYDYSIVTSDSGRSVLTTWKGTYDSKRVIARFTGHSSIWNDGQYIEADSMHYDKVSGYGFALGNVISIDTEQHSTMYCGRADYFRKKRILWATVKPVLELANGKDTFYMRADTFYSAPMIKTKGKAFRMPLDTADDKKDSLAVAKNKLLTDSLKQEIDTFSIDKGLSKKGKRKKKVKAAADTVVTTMPATPEQIDSMWVIPLEKYTMDDFRKDTAAIRPVTVKPPKGRGKDKRAKFQPEPMEDTTDADTTAPIFFTGYHHVLIFSDSMQAKCDSVTFTRSDTIVRMIYDPVAWARGSQIKGDTILMQLDTGSIRSMYVPVNAFVVSRSGPDKAQLFDQVQGQTLTAFFVDNSVNKMIVRPEAQSLYYSKDDDGAYVGMIEASSEMMRIFFADQRINTIKLFRDVHKTMTPMEKVDFPNARLSRFKWLYEQRPASKEELFR